MNYEKMLVDYVNFHKTGRATHIIEDIRHIIDRVAELNGETHIELNELIPSTILVHIDIDNQLIGLVFDIDEERIYFTSKTIAKHMTFDEIIVIINNINNYLPAF